MRIGELSRASGVPVPTIKFYLREGLLPAGELTSPNQARYGEAHLRRLHLIRALTDVGGLPLASVGKVVEAVEDHERPVHKPWVRPRGRWTPPSPTRSTPTAPYGPGPGPWPTS